jgi:hypothetical protein
MLHVVVDTSIYRADPKRKKTAFRALTRLGRGHKIQLHIPHYVKREFLSQQCAAIAEAINAIERGAGDILRKSDQKKLEAYGRKTSKNARELLKDAEALANEEFSQWVRDTHAIEHPIDPAHAQRVTDDYFSGAPPFTSAKHRQDLPDSFIWQTALDLSRKHSPLHVIAADGAIYDSASQNNRMTPHKTLESFIQTPVCQTALKELMDKFVATNVERVKAELHRAHAGLAHMVERDIVNALHGRTVYDSRIPDDNNEAMILSVGAPGNLTFDFLGVEYYGASELGVPFTTAVECMLSYAIFKADYVTMSEQKTKHISIGELNDHYFDAEEDYTVDVSGILSLTLDIERLQDDDLTDNDIDDLINDADDEVEILETEISGYANDPGGDS